MPYQRVNWEDSPSTATPLSAENLNKMDKGIADVNEDLTNLKAEVETAEGDLVSRIEATETELENKVSKGATYSITENMLQPGAVSTEKLKSKSVTSDKLYGVDNAISGSSTNLVTSAAVYTAIENAKSEMQENVANKLDNANNVIQTKHIANYAVTSVKIESGAVVSGKIANEAVTSTKLANGAISDINKISSSIIDTVPAKDSNNLISSGGVYNAISELKTDSLTLTVGFDKNNAVIKTVDSSALSAGSFTGNQAVKKVFVSSSVTRIFNSAFAGCTALTDIYIDRPQEAVSHGSLIIDDGAIPENVNVTYSDTGTFNTVTEMLKAVAYLNNNKYDKSNIETGTGSFTVSSSYAKYFPRADFTYLKVENLVFLTLDIDVTASSGALRYVSVSGLPFVLNPLDVHLISHLFDDVYLQILDNGTYFLLQALNGFSANTTIKDTIICQIKE